MSLDTLDLSFCKGSKNLLAFSAGIDSTALFFLLLKANIDFDIAIVNYQSRDSSNDEEAYAKKLASKYDKNCHILKSTLSSTHMEEEARKTRFNFFDTLVKEHHYETLITAHQLNDQLEWFLMQLTKGAGSLELLGMQKVSKREDYTLFKPLLEVSKGELLDYLDHHNHLYFCDESNTDQSLKRNYFRHNFSDKLIEEFQEGIVKSFNYIQKDSDLLKEGIKEHRYKQLFALRKSSIRMDLFTVDKYLKEQGYILSSSQRKEIEIHPSIVISDQYAIESDEKALYIVPYNKELSMEKSFKELCRLNKVPKKIRPYLYKVDPTLQAFKDLREALLS